MAELKLNNIYKIYDNKVTAVDNFNLHIEDKEFIVFVGPSGCGKSTTLRMMAGLEEISKGDFYIDDKRVNDIAPKDRDIAMVFQNYALYPHMTVYDNIAFGLKLRKLPKTACCIGPCHCTGCEAVLNGRAAVKSGCKAACPNACGNY